jgi:hypothetical protein
MPTLFGVRNTDPLDLARDAVVSASSTLDTLDPTVGYATAADAESTSAQARSHPLHQDLAIFLPVDPRLDGLSALLRVEEDTELTVSLWTTGKRQNAVPVDERMRTTISVVATAAPRWVELPVAWAPDEPENVVVILEANAHVAIELVHANAPGVLALPHRPEDDGDANVAVSHDERLVQWPAHILRGWGPRLRVDPPTSAYAADKAVGGFQRPYGGPQEWVSAASSGERDDWLLLEWAAPRTVREVRLVFDDDVDVELNTLHHHRSPHLVFPQLVRDYVIEGRSADGWRTLASVTGNRRRHRVHVVEPTSIDGLRLRVSATNGDPSTRVVSIRAYA